MQSWELKDEERVGVAGDTGTVCSLHRTVRALGSASASFFSMEEVVTSSGSDGASERC